MRKIGIITINDNNNYGNRLQNYATEHFLEEMSFEVKTIFNKTPTNKKKYFFLKYLKNIFRELINGKKNNRKRLEKFNSFNEYIKFYPSVIYPYNKKIKNEFDYFIVGSDQVWNPRYRCTDVDMLCFARDEQKISLAASFGISNINEDKKGEISKELKKFKAISVREDRGKEIVEELTGRTDVEVLVDPTMLLTAEEWDKVAKKPEQLKSDKRYILNYFLGNLSEERKAEIERIAKENDCEIINILDKNDPFYETGPSEFLYLEKNAFLICTDSFHSCVFAIIYNRPFVVFEREGNTSNMNSRIETLIAKFKLKDRTFNGKITKENLEHDYSEAYKILEIEREKSKKFLKKALDIESEKNEH